MKVLYRNIRKPASRRGVTLTEVLMSLMIMAIGATSVMTLFPIATLRSAQATKLTNSAIVKYNVEAFIEARPELIFDPDGDGDLLEHFREPGQRNYVVDPLGFAAIAEETSDITLAGALGDSDGSVPRFDGGLVAPVGTRAMRLEALQLAGLGDGWDTIYEFFVDPSLNAPGTISTSLTIPTDVIDLSTNSTLIPTSGNTAEAGLPDPEWTRIVLYDVDEAFSVSYPLLEISTGNVATWSETVAGTDYNLNGYADVRNLPREFGGTVGKVQIQTRRTTDFSWFLTVRRTADGRVESADVVVRFGSEPRLADQVSYLMGPQTEDINNDGTLDPNEDVNGNGVEDPILPITTVFLETTGDEPPLRRGGHIFDTAFGRWHRIRDFEQTTDPATYKITLEEPTRTLGTRALVLPGIVDVYPINSLSIPDELERGF